MSTLSDRIADKHQRVFNARDGLGPHCTCGWVHRDFNGSQKHVMHIAEVTEAAVREQVAREIEEAEVWAVRTDLLDRWGTSLGGRRIMSPHRAHMIVQLVRADAARIARGGAA